MFVAAASAEMRLVMQEHAQPQGPREGSGLGGQPQGEASGGPPGGQSVANPSLVVTVQLVVPS